MPKQSKSQSTTKNSHLSKLLSCQRFLREKIKEGEDESSASLTVEISKCFVKLAEDTGDSTVPLMQLKHVGNLVKTYPNEVPEFILSNLMSFFLCSDSKHPFKRAVLSILASLTDTGVEGEKLISLLADDLCTFLEQCGPEDNLPACGRHIVDTFFITLENVVIGHLVITKILPQVITFLGSYLRCLIDVLESGLSAVDKLKLSHDVTTTLKCCTSLVQKCILQVPKDVDHNLSKDISVNLQELINSCQLILGQDNFEGDCWNAAGIAWAAISKAVLVEKDFIKEVQSILQFMIQNISTDESEMISIKDNMFSGLSQFSECAQLGICNGFLVMMNSDQLTDNVNTTPSSDRVTSEKCILVDYMLEFMQLINARTKSLQTEVLVAKCFVQWSSVLKNCLKNPMPSFVKESLLKKSAGSSSVIDQLVEYSFIKLDHPVDAVRHQASDLLSKLLWIGRKLGMEEFSDHLLSNVLKQNWHKRSTFTALNCLLEYTYSSIFVYQPDILNILLEAMQQQSLTPYASETYRILARDCCGDRVDTKENPSYTIKEFLEPLFSTMCQVDHHYLRLLVDYCFTKLLKLYVEDCVSYTTEYFGRKITQSSSSFISDESSGALVALMSCTRTAMNLGYLRNRVKREKYAENGELWNGILPKNVIISALVHQDDEIRIMAFALLCESTKPSSLIETCDLEVIQYALPYNVSCQDPAFRQKLLNSCKKLMFRQHGNITSLEKEQHKTTNREKAKPDDSRFMLEAQCKFIMWLGRFSASHLYPEASYPKRITCISLLALVVEIFSEKKHLIDYNTIFSVQVVNSLFVLLSDPYEDVKQNAFNLLSSTVLEEYVTSVFTQQKLEELSQTAIERAYQCNKPEWCSDASYHVRLCAALHVGENELETSKIISLCNEMLNKLDESIERAKKNMFLASMTCPMYGLLHCLKCILEDIQFKGMPDEETSVWRAIISRMISSCFNASEAVLPVVGSVSPEGHLPDYERVDGVDGGSDDAWNKLPEALQSLVLGSGSEGDQDEMKTRAIAQTILVCCWRTAKESSLLLQELTSSRILLDSSKETHDGVLSWHQLLDIGEHLCRQLTEARHRGAFEIAYYAFKAYCPRLWRNEHKELNHVPERWLKTALEDIEDPERSRELCATRRSAGLPFFMQALLGGDKGPACKKSLHYVMNKLLSLCENEHSQSGNLIAKVHALNIMRGLIKDASLGEEILPYVSQCMQVALTGFGSSIWAVRNSSTLLYSALVTRIFGVKREKNDSLGLKNRLSGHDFFTRLPGLHSFLVSHLRDICSSLEKGGHNALNPVIHPILLLLSRIYPSTMQPAASTISLAEFVPLIIRCCSSAVYKSRIASATALASVLSCDQCLPVLQECCNNLSQEVEAMSGNSLRKNMFQSSRQNRIHGNLLQVKDILMLRICNDRQQSTDTKRLALEHVSSVICKTAPVLATRKNPCPVTRSTTLDLFETVHKMRMEMKFNEDSDNSWKSTTDMVKSSSISEISPPQDQKPAPGQTLLHHTLSKVLMLLTANSSSELVQLMKKILESGVYNIMLRTLEILLAEWDSLYHQILSEEGMKTLESMLVEAIERDEHDSRLHSVIYSLLSKCGSLYSAEHLFKRSILTASSCESSHSGLLSAVISFQMRCMQILHKKKDQSDLFKMTNDWIGVLSSASQAYENTDDVRLAAANALRTCTGELLLDKTGLLGEAAVRAWGILLHLLCDEEAGIRKVASDTLHKVALEAGVTNTDYPCVDTLGLEQCVMTLLATHGRRNVDACRHALQELTSTGRSVVPFSLDNRRKSSPEDLEQGATKREKHSSNEQHQFPGLFKRSNTNTYLDAVAVSRVAQMGLRALGDPEILSDGADISKLLSLIANTEEK